MSPRTKVIILGAAGRDFHDFNVYWKKRPDAQVVCFTATQIPDIEGRVYPPELAGTAYPSGIPIHAEDQLENLIRQHGVTTASLAYSDISYEYVMHLASRVNAAGASFCTLGAQQTMLTSSRPVISVCAVRTGCGKSQTTRRVSQILKDLGKRIAVVRHPMPYGDLTKQVCQRFATLEDMDSHRCTIEEREEYEPHIRMGTIVFAGIDYEQILAQAEQQADVVLWDGGNNDLPFFKPDLHIVVTDPHRSGHELSYYPGETNLRMAHVAIINKVDTAEPHAVGQVEANIQSVNPSAVVIHADSRVQVADEAAVKGKRVLVIEDGPTLTHGEMSYGAAHVAARRFGAAEIIDPRGYARGSIESVYHKYPHLTDVLPAMGYGDKQITELQETINAADCDLVLIGTPIDLARVLKINKPAIRVSYELAEHNRAALTNAVSQMLNSR